MHGRQSKQVRRFLRTRILSRSVATASALKPSPDLSKWAKVPASPLEPSKPSPQLRPDLGKWARPPQPVSKSAPTRQSAESFRPNISKWAPPNANEAPRKSILHDLDSVQSGSRPPQSFDRRRRPAAQNKDSCRTSQSLPARQATQRGVKEDDSQSHASLDRDSAPHLGLADQNLPNLREDVSRGPRVATRDRNLARILEADIEERHNSEDRFSRASNRYTKSVGSLDDSGARGNGNEDRSRRGQRDSFKLRGSVVERLRLGQSVEIPKQSRVYEDRIEAARRYKKKVREIQPVNLDVAIPSIISVGNLSRLLGVRLEALQKCMQRNDMEEQSSYDYMLSADDASLLAMEFNRNPVVDDEAAFDIYASPPHPDYASLPRRPPVVTIMGHVDHGKTTLLDTLRSSSVAKGEVGGITQHIGAFSVPVPGVPTSSDIPNTITFLDTPGHAAFSAMRARGAQVTDIIVLVVAADDGVMPQTREVIDLIKKDKGNVGVVVAINKVDKADADVENVQNALWAEGLELEAMGGDIPSVEVSGLTGHGLEQLVETISLLAEMQEIRSERDGPAHGCVLESKVVKGFGNTATVLLLRGNLTPSSHIISGTTFAKIRQLTDSAGKTTRIAYPGAAVIVSGWKELPSAGDEVLQGKENDVKRAVENRLRKASLVATLSDAEAINASRQLEREEREKRLEDETAEVVHITTKATGPKELRLVIKGDVGGSIEALAASVESIGNKEAITKVISTGVGDVTESDVMLAKAAEAMIIAFSVNVSRMAGQAAAQSNVPIFSSKIIYGVLDEVKEQVVKLLPPIVERRVTGEANVLQLFDINGKRNSIVKVAGCRVSNGMIEKDRRVRVVRNGVNIHEGTLNTLRILKRDVVEVKKGLECGIRLANFDDLCSGDLLQFYQEIEKPGQL
ncbi:hypothetical protein M0805_008987 [Coniferiporia weirii]|nr:hypothetical protein M0805_008987 [Coniferiporia weirii]